MTTYEKIKNSLVKHFSDKLSNEYIFIEETDRINVDKLIAFKDMLALDCQYVLQATISVHPEHLVPFFSLSLTEKDLDGNSDAVQTLLECDLSRKDLLPMVYNCVKKTSVLFDTRNYCNSLVNFLNEFKSLDNDLYKPSLETQVL
jgi:hypothetical protein